jgi:hypothetical protein
MTPRGVDTLVLVRCGQCGHENVVGAGYCSSCGSALPGGAVGALAGPGVGREADTTMSVALVDDRDALVAEVGEILVDLPEGVGMVVVRRGPNAGSTFVLENEETTLGRHPDSDIFLDDVTVSRRHAVIRRAEHGYAIADVGSLNGTYVDHQRIEHAELQDMQELQVGRFVLTFVVGAPRTGDRETTGATS